MRVKLSLAAASLVVGFPTASFALGLGEIQLKSTLNSPLNAEIELLGATAEELGGLRAQLASRETFARYGLEYPAYLSGIQVRFTRSMDNRPVIELRSSAPITEPFATLLVEVNYPRGRQVREYTVLLDPPVFAPPGAQPAAPVAAPVVGEGQRSGEVARPAAPAAPAAATPAPRPAAQAAPSAATGGTYEVRRGDTLSRIAAGVVGTDTTQQRRAMIAIYRGNTDAFDGNINLLRSGAVLRLPDADAIAGVDAAEATAEVRRQSASWQAGRPAGAPVEDARLRLVPPGETPSAAPGTGTAGAGTGAGGNADLQRRVDDLERQLAESRRQLELRNAELARLQGQPPSPPNPLPRRRLPRPSLRRPRRRPPPPRPPNRRRPKTAASSR
jgi:pilus assembly protein FimV